MTETLLAASLVQPAPLIEPASQWRAESLQVINWGGFHGHHRVDFAEGATLISGASGTGKSTLLDAYIALMMPSTVPFNGASNDATTGRARGVDQRNILTYLRGKRDSAGHGETLTDQVLRGDGESVWGAIAVTFTNGTRQRFTVMRVYSAPPGAQRPSEVTLRMLSLNGEFDLHDLAEFADSRFDPRLLRARFSGLAHHKEVGNFIDTITTRLGIGANGDGDKALRLLARIQAGHQVKTVDSLYKQMVLEEPGTLASADAALEHFRDLDQSYKDLEDDGAKEQILRRIGGLHDDYERSRARAERLDRFGVARPDDITPFGLWALRTEYRLLADGVRDNQSQREEVQAALTKAKGEVGTLGVEIKDIEEQQRANGGGALERLAAKIEEAVAAQEKVTLAKTRFDVRTDVLALSVPDEETFTQVRTAAAHFLDTADEREQAQRDERDGHVAAIPELTKHRNLLSEEYASLKRRDGRVPVGHDRARNQVAEACGMRPQDLPFAAELMDVHPDFEDWRLAAEVTLGGIGLTMLMDERRQQHIRETIDGLRLDQRIRFEGVDLTALAPEPSDSRYISGRLVFKDSPFTAWVKNRVTQSNTDHLCVDHPSRLGGSEPKVTVNGQVSRGRRGAHGWNRDQKPILGFSNASRLQEIEIEARAITAKLAEHESASKALEDQIATARRRAEAYRTVMATEWESIDVARVEAEIANLERQRESLLEKSDILAELQRKHAEVTARLETARKESVLSDKRFKDLNEVWSAMVERQDSVSRDRETMERSGTVVLSEEDDQHLTDLFEAQEPGVDHMHLRSAAERLRSTLRQESGRERDKARDRAAQLTGVFERYNDRWPDPNRGSSVEEYPTFAAIYDEIVKHGLFERRQVFKRRFQKWSGDDLKMLNDAYDVALTEIEERLDPINDIMSNLDFGAQHDRLRIVMRVLHPKPLETFRRQLRVLTSNVTVDWTDDQADERFRQLRQFMKQLAKPEPGAPSTRDDLLDVRKHIEITASRVDTTGREVSTYSAIGGKSGGESQELVAFIVGAALRYQLGDETRTLPRFAPVFLDEGFVKSDGNFAGRAVKAWRGLGFQLIIGAPLDKVTALEPHMDLNWSVTKNEVNGYSFVTPFRDAPPQPARHR